ncbi:MAG: preprotein translocase subunit SecE [Candidatus Saccharibacteria bacterium]|nr:preprotein translocase subunit SecE [Candidatus Saccharibacteria bacterium]
MAKITRIKASDTSKKEEKSDEPTITRKKVVVKDKKSEKVKREKAKAAEKQITSTKTDKSDKKPFILIRPFVYLWRYLRDSWMELRQVRWPTRKYTWKMVLAVIIYSALFMVIISLLDLFFSWLFGLILGNN